jgi:hypothetical protein
MYRNRIRHNRKRWRTKWPWKWVFPLRIDERFCRECGFPFHEGPLPKPVKSCSSGSVEAVVYPAGGFRRDEYAVQIGRVRSGRGQLYLSELVPVVERDDVYNVLAQLEVWFDEPDRKEMRVR